MVVLAVELDQLGLEVLAHGPHDLLAPRQVPVGEDGSGTVTGGGEIRLAARPEFANNRAVTVQNLTVTVTNSAIRESPCGENITFRNNRLVNSTQSVC
ncbi:hypothetical protein GA0115245_123337 [Streptomyces sp. di188]|nr:hypothetical protein GA0115238_106415 [Streptomyces sp. di50b]SCE15267.1 hypothetical protein GA0115245_123337 [Streptomyces sp. di188]